MRLYEITYNGRKWETTNFDEAFKFLLFMLCGEKDRSRVKTKNIPYTGPEIPNIQVA